MGKSADLTDVQKKVIDTLYKEGKSQKVIAKEVGCSQSSVSKHIHKKLSGREKCGRSRCTSKTENRSLERIVQNNPFKNLRELHQEWTETGVTASRATTHRRILEMGYKCNTYQDSSELGTNSEASKQDNGKKELGWIETCSEVINSGHTGHEEDSGVQEES